MANIDSSVLKQKFSDDKKSIKFDDCIAYIEAFGTAEDKKWFYKLATESVDGKPRQFLSVKKAFYDRFIKENPELSKRKKLLAGWNLTDEDVKDVELNLTETKKKEQ